MEGVQTPPESATAAPTPFASRHLGPRGHDLAPMLSAIGCASLEELIDQTVPAAIRLPGPLELPGLPEALTEHAALGRLRSMAEKNQVLRSMIGMGYHDTVTPPPILRNILENPLWYTPYTPYQAEISQGRLEALLNFQTMVSDLTGLPLASASLLDEATAAAEAMAMCFAIARQKRPVFLVSADCHPQTLAVIRTRAESMGIDARIVSDPTSELSDQVCGVLVQSPATDGRIEDHGGLVDKAHAAGALVVAACDLLALTLMKPPGEWGQAGADIAVGNTQRFGVPMGYGGPHAAFMATQEKHARKMPGRIVGVSKDAHGNPAYRLAIQTREQHIRRDKATSNICTSQVLLAVMAGMYAVYHGPTGLTDIARRVHAMARALAQGLGRLGHELRGEAFFDTLAVSPARHDADTMLNAALGRGINLRKLDDDTVGIALDETTTPDDLRDLLEIFADGIALGFEVEDLLGELPKPSTFEIRHSKFLQHGVFNRYHSEHELLRYITRLQRKDISLADSMIPLGSCTMKLNAAAEMLPVTWPQFGGLHPLCPPEQARGYAQLFKELEAWLAAITGFDAASLQPNAGSQGEYAGLLAIRGYHAANAAKPADAGSRASAEAGAGTRDVCLIPTSAHGTNPASAVIAGFRVVPVACDDHGNIDLDDLRDKAEQHADRLGCLMITYPSTHGVFEEGVKEACRVIHDHGGQVYMDGANMNAQVGVTSPGAPGIGADVCHLNLHKTFCIPHGGGGPGMGPIAVREHLRPYLPREQWRTADGRWRVEGESPTISAAPHGSASILPISWMYIAMMAAPGLTRATQIAILNANYMAARLRDHYDVLYTGASGRVAHEFIVDCRPFEKSANVRVEDIAKRLMDFGYHAPTMSFPVPGTLMIEPTESESREELDRFCDAMIAIREEIAAIEAGELDREDNPLRHAPHPAAVVSADDWPHPYGREQAAYPRPWVRESKYWPPVSRIDNAHGDRHLICTCPPMEEYGKEV